MLEITFDRIRKVRNLKYTNKRKYKCDRFTVEAEASDTRFYRIDHGSTARCNFCKTDGREGLDCTGRNIKTSEKTE